MMTNRTNRVLYTGVTRDLKRRVYQHRKHLVRGFTDRYNAVKLVYYECCDDIVSALAREKQIKGGPRRRKEDLVNSMNPEWRDLYDDL
jgi:putative endonuclease